MSDSIKNCEIEVQLGASKMKVKRFESGQIRVWWVGGAESDVPKRDLETLITSLKFITDLSKSK